jgi:hypothetical protein
MGDFIGIAPRDCIKKEKLDYLVVFESIQSFLEETLAQPGPVAGVKIFFVAPHPYSLWAVERPVTSVSR